MTYIENIFICMASPLLIAALCMGCLLYTSCQNDGSHKETGDHTPGTAATCKAPANCSICGQLYGEKNPSNHTGGTEVRNQKEATTTTEGYTGDRCV